MAGFDDARIRLMILGAKRAFRVVDFPGAHEIKIAVRLLTEREIDACRVEGQRQFLSICSARGWSPEKAVVIDPLMHTRLVDRQIVWRAFYDADSIGDPDKARPFFASENDVAELDATTTADLFQAYIEHQDLVTPARHMGEEEVKALVDALGKGHTPGVVLRSFERSTLESFALSMAKRLST